MKKFMKVVFPMKVVFSIVLPLLILSIYLVFAKYQNFADRFGGLSNIIILLTAILTYTYVVFTGLMVSQMKTMHEDEYRAYMIADIEFHDDKAWITLKNIGKTSAKNVSVSISPEILAGGKFKLSETNFSKPIGFFQPSRSYETAIHCSTEFLKNGMPREYTITLTYELTNTVREITEENHINLEYLAYRMFPTD